MGNCTGTIKKKNVRPYGRSALVEIKGSTSYATGGDTVPISILGIGNRLSALIIGSSTTPSGHQVELIPGATEYAAPKLRFRTAAGVEVANATNISTESFYAEAIASPFK